MKASLAAALAALAAATPLTAQNRMFGHSIKNGNLVARTEIELFSHACGAPPCTITQIHVPTAGPDGWSRRSCACTSTTSRRRRSA